LDGSWFDQPGLRLQLIKMGIYMLKRIAVLMVTLLILVPVSASAAPDEIVVFTDEFEKPGEVGYELHLNYARRSRSTPNYAGEQPPHHVVRLMPEIVWGLSEKWNLGLHFPLSIDRDNKLTADGVKVRMHYLDVNEYSPGSTFFYGANFEIAYYDERITESKYNGEIRGILGTRQGDWRFTVNPILTQALSKNPGGRHVDFEIFGQVLRELPGDIAVGIEHYSSIGPVRNTTWGTQSEQITYLVTEFKTRNHFDLHLGVGHGWTTGTDDKLVFKALVGIPF